LGRGNSERSSRGQRYCKCQRCLEERSTEGWINNHRFQEDREGEGYLCIPPTYEDGDSVILIYQMQNIMLNQVNRVEIAKWVAESQHPFSIVEDGGHVNELLKCYK
jgi:hypothetical protein